MKTGYGREPLQRSIAIEQTLQMLRCSPCYQGPNPQTKPCSIQPKERSDKRPTPLRTSHRSDLQHPVHKLRCAPALPPCCHQNNETTVPFRSPHAPWVAQVLMSPRAQTPHSCAGKEEEPEPQAECSQIFRPEMRRIRLARTPKAHSQRPSSQARCPSLTPGLKRCMKNNTTRSTCSWWY